jgi:putative DNA primase/helicase
MMLGVKNGVIDLRTGTFRPALPEDLMTQQCNVTYDPNASAPLWKQFILQVSNGDVDLATYKQLCWGYSLTGETSEQCFFFLYGWGCNGKSTETGAMQELMGSYAKTISSNVLMVKHNYGNQGPTPEIARLVGARLVTANETEDGARLAEAQIKAMTGQDMLTARVLQGNPFDFKPKFKLFISGNHKPVIRGEDDGIWRRIKVIPFDMQVKDSDIDKQLFQKLMAEKSGILNWAIQGCLLWQENGKLLEPQIVKTEVASYRSDQDIMGAWLEEKCVLTPEKQCSTRELFINYSEWVRASGSNPVTETRFSTRLIERGFTKQRINQKMTFIGIGLVRQFN